MGVKRPALLIGGAILLAAGAAGVWLTGSPDTAPRATKAATKPADIDLVPQAAAPPEPTSTDFASAAPPTPVPADDSAADDSAADDSAADDSSADGSATGRPEQPAPHQPLRSTGRRLPIDELRTRANADEIPAMEEMARRLVQGIGRAQGPAGRRGLAAARRPARLGAVGLQCRRDV